MSVVLLSGGLDSAVLLASEVTDGRHVACISFDYGQRHGARELDAARRVAKHYGLRMNVFTIPNDTMMNSSLTGIGTIPDAHYSDPVQKSTVVPNRNMVMISIAASMALTWNEPDVCFAAHAGDSAIYPDCRAGFVEAMSEVTRLACGVQLRAPFLGMTKREIVQLGRSLSVPLSMTWSCYKGGDVPCRSCGACVEREEALS